MSDENGGQLALFVRPVARASDPSTSWQAARDAAANAGNNRARVLRALLDVWPQGLTDYELAALVGLQQNSAGKRRGELRDAGFVEDTGERRPAPSGSLAIVWRAVR